MLSKNTESFVTKKFLHDQATLQRAIQALSNEISPTVFPACDSTQYRKNLALNLFYKVIVEYTHILVDFVDCIM